jgi:hypothetical protein
LRAIPAESIVYGKTLVVARTRRRQQWTAPVETLTGLTEAERRLAAKFLKQQETKRFFYLDSL